MFKIDVKFLEEHPPKAAYSDMSIDEIYCCLSWEAALNITYNNKVLFSEEVAIVEFYWYLVKWYHKCIAGKREPFVYSSVEYTDPILVFLPQPSHCWKIDSIWRRCDTPILVKEEILYSQTRTLIECMMLE